jgi:hypothetical protein
LKDKPAHDKTGGIKDRIIRFPARIAESQRPRAFWPILRAEEKDRKTYGISQVFIRISV